MAKSKKDSQSPFMASSTKMPKAHNASKTEKMCPNCGHKMSQCTC